MDRTQRNPFDWVLAAATALIGTGSIVVAFQLGVGSAAAPGPGAWPLLIGVLMLVLDAWFLLRLGDAPYEAPSLPSRWGKFAVALLSLFGYALVLDPLGYLVATFLLLLVQLRWVEDRSFKVSVATALVASGTSFVIFVYFLKVALPPGIIPLGGA